MSPCTHVAASTIAAYTVNDQRQSPLTVQFPGRILKTAAPSSIQSAPLPSIVPQIRHRCCHCAGIPEATARLHHDSVVPSKSKRRCPDFKVAPTSNQPVQLLPCSAAPPHQNPRRRSPLFLQKEENEKKEN
jgi:hypothetical protein